MSVYDALSIGILRRVALGETVQNPILQCLQVKAMAPSPNGMQRYRLIFSDTIHFIQSMMSQQSNHLVEQEIIRKGAICRLTAFQANVVKEKPILIVLNVERLEEYGDLEKLGEPITLDSVLEEEQAKAEAPADISGNGFYGNQQPAQNTVSRPRPTDSAHGNIHPIEALSPYAHRWTIRARCTHKSEIKTWHNKNGEGKLFSANFLDDSGEIRATGFKESVDQWYDFLQEGGVYYISSPCRVQLAKKQFSNVNNDYELTFERDTVIEKANDNEGVPQVRYNFTGLSSLDSIEKDTTIDAIGILQNIGEISEIVSKTTQKPFNKREITIADKTGFSVRLTLWGNTAQTFDVAPESVIAFKGLKVSDFGGRTLSLLSSGSMSIDPDIDEAHSLKGWYDAAGRSEQFQSHASAMGSATGTRGNEETKSVQQIRDENLGMTEKDDYFNLCATIIYVKQDNFAYPSCLNEGCQKKVREEDDGSWRCEKCNVAHAKPEWRYIMSLNVSDHTGAIWLSCFDDTGRLVMGISADEATAIKEEGDQRAIDMFTEATGKKLTFRCRAKMDSFQDQQRVRYQVVGASEVNFAAEAKRLVDVIKQYEISDEEGLFVN